MQTVRTIQCCAHLCPQLPIVWPPSIIFICSTAVVLGSAEGHLPPIIHYTHFFMYYLLFFMYYWLCFMYYSLCIMYYSLSIIDYVLCIILYVLLLCIMYYSLCIIDYVLCIMLRLHSLFLKKLHDIQICFQQEDIPTFLSVNFKPNVLWILKNDHESIGGASERKWKENYHNINIKKYFYTSSKKSSLCYHFDLINFSLLLLF